MTPNQQDTAGLANSDDRLDPFTKALLDDAKRFDQHALEKADRVQKRMLVLVVAMCAVTAVAVVAAVVQAMNTREVQPYVLIKDEQTGAVKELTRLEPETLRADWALAQASVAAYVRARMEYSSTTIEHNYETVELMSTPTVMEEYRNYLHPEVNPRSPLALYEHGIVDIEVTAIVNTSQSGGAAQAHFVRTVKNVSSPPPPSHWIANIEYAYADKNMTVAARFRNPLGFTVTAFSLDEVAPGRAGAAQGALR